MERSDEEFFVKEFRRYYPVLEEEGRWTCRCGYMEKCGLPCRHIIRVLIFRKGSILEHLPERWKAKRQPESIEVQISKRGRERSSKRRIFL